MSRPVPVHAEKRRNIRPRRLRRALCVYNNGHSTHDVLIRNISPDGAKIAGHELLFLPQTFELRVLDDSGGYSARDVKIVWNRGETAGIAFID